MGRLGTRKTSPHPHYIESLVSFAVIFRLVSQSALTQSVAKDEAGRLETRRGRVDSTDLKDALVIVDDVVRGSRQLGKIWNETLLSTTPMAPIQLDAIQFDHF